MASIKNRVNVAFTIPVEQTTIPTGGGQIRLSMRADIKKTKRMRQTQLHFFCSFLL